MLECEVGLEKIQFFSLFSSDFIFISFLSVYPLDFCFHIYSFLAAVGDK